METWFSHRSVGEMRPGDHAWLGYSSDEEQERVIGTFVRTGLATADKVIYVSDSAPQEIPGIGGWADPSRFVDSGQLRIIPRREAYLTDDRFDAELVLTMLGAEIVAAEREGYRGIRVTGDEMSWATVDPGDRQRLIACERQVDAAIAPSTTVMAICQVDRRQCAAEDLRTLRELHEVMVHPDPEFEDGVLRIVRTYAPCGLRIEGELDAARHTVFIEALEGVAAADGEVHLDLADLRFIDLRALGVLADLTSRRLVANGVVLDNVPPQLRDVIELVGWHMLPGVRPGRGEAR